MTRNVLPSALGFWSGPWSSIEQTPMDYGRLARPPTEEAA